MADMETNLLTIATGRYGKDVRAAIHDAIEENADDIADLKTRPTGGASLILTGQRRLTTSEAGKIAGLDVSGKSAQEPTVLINNFNLTWVAYTAVSGLFYVDKYFQDGTDIKPSDNDVKANIGSNVFNTVTQVEALSGTRGIAVDRNGSLIVSDSRLTSAANVNNVLNSLGTVIYTPEAPTPTHPIPIQDASGVIQAVAVKQINSGFEQGGIGHTVNADYAANKVTSTTRIRLSELLETISGKEYTLTCGAGYKAIVQSFNEAGQLVDTAGSNAWNNPLKVTAAAFMGIALCKADGSSITPADSPSAGLTITPYASNQIDLSAYDLRSAGSIADTLVINNDGSGKLTQRVTSKLLNGTENWSLQSINSSGIANFTITLTDSTTEFGNATPSLCSHFIQQTSGISATTTEGYMLNGQRAFFIRINSTIANNVEAFKSWLSSNNVTLYYALATPIETPLTADQVAEILALETYAPETIIETELDLQSVDYLGDVKGYIDSKNEYSYTDQIIGKWADGSDLHRMVIQATTPNALASTTVIASIPNNITIKRIDGIVSVGNQISDPININMGDYYIATWADGTNIKMRISSDLYKGKPCEIIVEYTLKDAAPAALSLASELIVEVEEVPAETEVVY